MRILDELRFELWHPDLFHSRGAGVDWVRLSASGVGVVANSLESVRFEADPIEWIRCEECARERCGSGAYARVTRTASHLLFTAPDVRRRAPADVLHTHPLVLEHGALALPVDRWSALVDRAAEEGVALPPETVLEEAGWRELWAAWVSPLPPLLRRLEPRAFVETLGRTLPERSRERQAQALDGLVKLVRWFRSGCFEGRSAALLDPTAMRTRVVTLVLDEHRGDHWPAFAQADSGELYPAFGADLVLLIDPPPARAKAG